MTPEFVKQIYSNCETDIIINNAGIIDQLLSVTKVNDETWQRVFDVNVTGLMRFFRAAIPEMLKNPGDAAGFNKGVFVSVGSIASQCGMKSGATYTVSKHTVGLAKNKAVMFAKKGIRSNVIAGIRITGIDRKLY